MLLGRRLRQRRRARAARQRCRRPEAEQHPGPFLESLKNGPGALDLPEQDERLDLLRVGARTDRADDAQDQEERALLGLGAGPSSNSSARSSSVRAAQAHLGAVEEPADEHVRQKPGILIVVEKCRGGVAVLDRLSVVLHREACELRVNPSLQAPVVAGLGGGLRRSSARRRESARRSRARRRDPRSTVSTRLDCPTAHGAVQAPRELSPRGAGCTPTARRPWSRRPSPRAAPPARTRRDRDRARRGLRDSRAGACRGGARRR